MSRSQQWDSLEFPSLDLGYDLISRELSDEPRLVSGSQNTYVTMGGKLAKRPGTIQVDAALNTTLTSRIDRVWALETLDSPAIIYLLASAYNTGTSKWGLWYIRLDAVSPAWTTAGTLRDLNASTRPHELVVSRGLAYVKGYPSSSEKLGTVIFDGTAGTVSTKFWGLLGPTTAARFSGSTGFINESSTFGITAAQTTFHISPPTFQNKVLYSEQFDNAIWVKNTCTVTADNTAAPDGTTTADLLTPSGADSYLRQDITSVVGVTYVASVWLKSATGSPVTMSLNAVDGVNSAATVCAVTTSWQRFSVSQAAGTTSTVFFIGGGSSLATGENIYAWGAQFEIGSTAGIYQRKLGLTYNLPSAPFNLQIDSELLTCSNFDTATGIATVLRGAQGTVAAAHADKELVIYRDWSASSHPGAVNVFWAYSYAYKSLTGHISNRAPLETNPDSMPSETGPFFNLIPKINLQGHSDTTNVPTIVVYRTTDGGGTFMRLAEVTNLGAFPISYSDTNLASTAGSLDPTPDTALNSQDLAASLTSNGPPPTVLAPLVTGTDTPAASTPMASYAGRLWVGIGNVVFFSANEELNVGIPEESWPSGLFGNFYRFPNGVTNLKETTDALYIMTTQGTFQVTGSTKNTFSVKPVLTDIGGAAGHPRAISRYGDTVVFMTHDLRIGIIQGSNFRSISDPLSSDFVTLINSNSAEIAINYFASLEKEWITVAAICPTSTDTRLWVYDVKKSLELKKDFWSAPWNVRASAIISGRLRETKQERRLAMFTWTGSTGLLTRFATGPTENTGTDAVPGALTTQFPFLARTGLFRVPGGNHLNALRRPSVIPIIYNVVAERTAFAADSDPITNFYIDDTWNTPIPATVPNDPSRSDASQGFRTLVYPIQVKGRRIGVELKKTDTDLYELQNLIITWESDAGAGL